jgi:hypothetical protein
LLKEAFFKTDPGVPTRGRAYAFGGLQMTRVWRQLA